MTRAIAVVNQVCRVCGNQLPQEALLRFNNMPKSAQFMPDISNVHEDVGVTLEIFQCGRCGVVQTVGAPVHYYKEVIRAAAFSAEMSEFRQRQFSEFIDQYGLAGKRFLEVGCGRGEYLRIFKNAGVQAFGTEYGTAVAAECSAAGLNVEEVYIDGASTRLQHAPFDGFAALNFMEHWPDPNAVLSGIGNNLAEDAIGLVEVPNFEMILREGLFTEFIADHVFYFDRETFETTLRLNGFEVLRCQSIWYDYILSAVVRKRRSVDVHGFSSRQAGLQAQINAFISPYVSEGVAVWGAGHQALATLALLNLSQGIQYVLDSAPFKQGKFTPATHLPIYSPERLESEPVRAIIVMAAAYSDEVVRTIRAKHGHRFALAVLRETGLEVL